MPDRIKISEIMSKKPIVVDVDDTIFNAAHLLRKNNISGLVVIKNKEAVAVITDKDIINKVVAENLSPRDIKVKDCMSSEMITAGCDETVTEVAMKMAANTISRMPVLDSDGNVKGVITKTDIMKMMPGLVNVLYEQAEAEEIMPLADRSTTDGQCEECGNHSDELIKVDGKWICEVCADLKEA